MLLFPIRSRPLPDNALLNRYYSQGAYTDCYTTDIPMSISQSQYVSAFYTTFVFKLERFILKWTVAKPSTDAQVKQLANGSIDKFAAWTVETRTENQLLMCDFKNLTRSWLMTSPLENGTRLYFGSAVVPRLDLQTGKSKLGFVVRALLGFHKLYSVVLLYEAKLRLGALQNSRE